MRQHLGHRGRNISDRWIWFSSSSPLSSPSVTSLSLLLRWRRVTAIRQTGSGQTAFKLCFISDKSGGVWRGRTEGLREVTWRPCDLQAVCRQVHGDVGEAADEEWETDGRTADGDRVAVLGISWVWKEKREMNVRTALCRLQMPRQSWKSCASQTDCRLVWWIGWLQIHSCYQHLGNARFYDGAKRNP